MKVGRGRGSLLVENDLFLVLQDNCIHFFGQTMSQVGEKAVLTCGSEYAYGKNGSPPKIPADATLKFDVELLSYEAGGQINDEL